MKLTGENLSVFDVAAVAVKREPIDLDQAQVSKVEQTFKRIQEWGAAKYPIYGVNTGFGELVHHIIPPQYKSELQANFLRSHAAGAGAPFPDDVVRAIMTVRLNCFLKGYSGVSPHAVGLLQEFINRGIHPYIPQQGSLGASGDLSPLSHMGLTLIGDGFVRIEGELRPTAEVLKQEHLEPVSLGYKEALAMANGTSAMAGVASLAIVKAHHLLKLAVLATADIVQCLQGSTRPFEHRGHALKNHTGQISIAHTLRQLLAESDLTREHRDIMRAISQKTAQATQPDQVIDVDVSLQDAYSLRCIPQILGPVLDTFVSCQKIFEEEINSCNDNPLIFETPEEIFHGGNFHGQYMGMYCDFMNIALTEIGVAAERQLNRLVDPHLNTTLPPFLAYTNAGLFSGFEGAQYLATSIAAENLDLAAPASVKSIPSNGSNQDIVSMGLTSARKSLQLCENVTNILAVLLSACYQASLFVGQERFSPAIRQLHQELSTVVSQYQDAFPIYQHIAKVREYILSEQGQACVASLVDFTDTDLSS